MYKSSETFVLLWITRLDYSSKIFMNNPLCCVNTSYPSGGYLQKEKKWTLTMRDKTLSVVHIIVIG